MKKKTATRAANLESRFNAGADVLDYFDTTAAVRGDARPKRGGARQGAGRKPKPGKRVRMNLTVSFATRRRLQSYARAHQMSLAGAVEQAATALG